MLIRSVLCGMWDLLGISDRFEIGWSYDFCEFPKFLRLFTITAITLIHRQLDLSRDSSTHFRASQLSSLLIPRCTIKYSINMAELEVDYEHNVTDLYKYISESKWDSAIQAAKEFPEQARTWVVRYHPDSTDIMWRFLPIHSASAKQPPENVVNSLISAYRKGAQCRDDQGMLPLHYACGNQASIEVIRLLLLANPEGTSIPDPHGMLPLHFMAQWGPSSLRALDAMLFANRDSLRGKDNDGYTALDLAVNGEYDGNDDVVRAIKEFEKDILHSSGYDKEVSPVKDMVLLPNASDAMKRLQEAAVVQEKARNDYMMNSSEHNAFDDRDDEHSVLGAMPNITRTFSSYQDNKDGMPTIVRQMSSLDDSQFVSMQSNNEAKKMVSALKAEVERLRAEAAMAEKDADRTISEERNKMQAALDEMKAHLEKCEEDTKESVHQLDEKEQRGKFVESRMEDKENELNVAVSRNEKMRKELETLKKDVVTCKTKTTKLDSHLSTLSRTMGGMISEQEQIMKASIKHEQHMKRVALERQQKMQELIDQEVNFARISLEKQKQNELGSEEMINEALENQKKLMTTVQSVLNERRNV